jgi:hypothetical protein
MNASASGVNAYVEDIFNDAGKKFDAYAGKILQNGRQKIGSRKILEAKVVLHEPGFDLGPVPALPVRELGLGRRVGNLGLYGVVGVWRKRAR